MPVITNSIATAIVRSRESMKLVFRIEEDKIESEKIIHKRLRDNNKKFTIWSHS
jgi:hypothetical protein